MDYNNESVQEILVDFQRRRAMADANISFVESLSIASRGGYAMPTVLALTGYFSLGLFTNLLVIYLSYFSKHIKEDFRLFFGNLAAIDSLFALAAMLSSIFTHVFLYYLRAPFDPYLCTVTFLLSAAFVLCMVPGVMLTSFHRYMVIVRLKKHFFSKTRKISLILFCYFPLLWPISVLSSRKFVDQSSYGCYKFSLPYEYIVLTVPMTLIICAHAFFVIRLFAYLSKNMEEVAATLQKPVEVVKKERSLLRAMLIHGLLPVITVMPPGYTVLVVHLASNSEVGSVENILEESKLPLFGYSVQQSVLLLAYLNPFFDSLTTLLVVKAYREALKLTLLGLWKSTATHAPVVVHVRPAQA